MLSEAKLKIVEFEIRRRKKKLEGETRALRELEDAYREELALQREADAAQRRLKEHRSGKRAAKKARRR